MTDPAPDPRHAYKSFGRLIASGNTAVIAFGLAPERGEWGAARQGSNPEYATWQFPYAIVIVDRRPHSFCLMVHNLREEGGSCEVRPGTPEEAVEHKANERCVVVEFDDTHTELVMADAALDFSVDDAVRLERLMGQALNCVPILSS